MGNFNFAGIEGAFKPVSHVLKLSPESDVQRLHGTEKSKPHCHCNFIIRTWLKKQPVIKTRNRENFIKIIIRNELTDVIIIHFVWRELSEEQKSRLCTHLATTTCMKIQN